MIRDLLLGKEIIESRAEFKYALLRAQLGLLLGGICFVYIFIDIFNRILVYIPWYFAGIVIAIFVIQQNRKGNYLIASVILLIAANMLVFLTASLEDTQGGAFFYFVATSATGLVVLNPLSKKLGMLFVGFSVTLAAIAYFGDRLPIPAPEGTESYEKISFTVNFILGLLSSIAVLLFVMNRNAESESILLGNQEKLQAITKELEKSKNRFALAVDGTNAGIYEWNIDTNKVYVSARYKNLLGFDSKEDLNMNLDVLSSMTHPEDKERSLTIIKESFRSGGTYQNELRLKRKNGRYRWFLDSGIVSKKKGAQKLAVGSIIDIHDRKIAEQQLKDKNKELEKTNEELDRFVYSASHDMRAPLSTLLGLLNLVKLTNNRSEINGYHEMMRNRINTMEGFIREVTDYSRNSRLGIVSSKFKVRTLVNEIVKSFEFLANEAHVTFNIEIKPNLIINNDKSRLKVILNNLVSNAIKYHDQYKTERFVKVHVVEEAGCCIIRVVDNGIGILPDYQEKIFDMFFRASEKSDGSGLGLYIVRETLHRIKGSITCSSEQNIGSTFEVRIPSI